MARRRSGAARVQLGRCSRAPRAPVQHGGGAEPRPSTPPRWPLSRRIAAAAVPHPLVPPPLATPLVGSGLVPKREGHACKQHANMRARTNACANTHMTHMRIHVQIQPAMLSLCKRMCVLRTPGCCGFSPCRVTSEVPLSPTHGLVFDKPKIKARARQDNQPSLVEGVSAPTCRGPCTTARPNV